MDFFSVVDKRRSIRKYTDKNIPGEVIKKAFEAAVLAPNSSNAQTWNFYWVKSEAKKQKLIEACLNQSAARTAKELIVIVADPKAWRRSQPQLLSWVQSIQAPKKVILYYDKLLPNMYRWGFMNSIGFFKKIIFNIIGFFRPIMRGPGYKREIQDVAVKSAALAAENFVLAITAQGFATCMMEGFDEWRVKRLLGLGCSERVVMVISVGEEAERGTWGPRFRIPLEQVVHEI